MKRLSPILTIVAALGVVVPGCARERVPAVAPTGTPRDVLRIERDLGRFNVECGGNSVDVGCSTVELVSVQLPPPEDGSAVDIVARATFHDFVTDPVARVAMDIQPPKPEGEAFWPEPISMDPGEVEVRSDSPSQPESRTIEWVARDLRVPGPGSTVYLLALQEIQGSGVSVVIEVSSAKS